MNPDAPNKNRFYALLSRGEQKESLDVVTGMLQVFSIHVYALLDPCATLPIVILLVYRKFNGLPDVPMEPLSVTTPVGESVVARRVFSRCPISLPNKFT